MVDIVDAATRSRMMAGIRGKDTKPELQVRKALHARGFRYRLHGKKLPGRPDMVFAKHKALLFVHGCFWHAHDCPLFRWPATRADFWRTKIAGNQDRDVRNIAALLDSGWRVAIVWECALKGRLRKPLNEVIDLCENWLMSSEATLQVAGQE